MGQTQGISQCLKTDNTSLVGETFLFTEHIEEDQPLKLALGQE